MTAGTVDLTGGEEALFGLITCRSQIGEKDQAEDEMNKNVEEAKLNKLN